MLAPAPPLPVPLAVEGDRLTSAPAIFCEEPRMTLSTPLRQSEPKGGGLVARVWVQVTALVLLCGLAILGFLGSCGSPTTS